jgi:hypothetical protein
MTMRRLTDEPLRVTPELVGTPLASPVCRALAFGVDMALVAGSDL